jgi:hypothetical protein
MGAVIFSLLRVLRRVKVGRVVVILCICTLLLIYFNVDALQNFTGGNLLVVGENATASIWATYPTEGISNGIGFVDQVWFLT